MVFDNIRTVTAKQHEHVSIFNGNFNRIEFVKMVTNESFSKR